MEQELEQREVQYGFSELQRQYTTIDRDVCVQPSLK